MSNLVGLGSANAPGGTAGRASIAVDLLLMVQSKSDDQTDRNFFTKFDWSWTFCHRWAVLEVRIGIDCVNCHLWYFALSFQYSRLYCHLVRVDDISAQFDFHLFKEGIKPMWEVSVKCLQSVTTDSFWLQDEANRFGGKWIVRLRKGLAARCWENLILAMMGEQFMVGEEICGVVVAKRVQVRMFGRLDDTFFSRLILTGGSGVHLESHSLRLRRHQPNQRHFPPSHEPSPGHCHRVQTSSRLDQVMTNHQSIQ